MKNLLYKAAKHALTCSAILIGGALASHAQTTNYVVYNFNTDQVDGTWGNWFGGDFVSVAWDDTTDATPGNPTPGSMEVNLDVTASGDQYVLFDGFSPGYSINTVTMFTNLSFDILFATNSAIRTNTQGAGVDGSTGVGSLDYGYMRVGVNDSYAQDWYYYFAVPATNGSGQPNTNWTHISIPLNKNTLPATDYTLTDILIGIDGGNYHNNLLSGNQTYWVDNIQFIGPFGGVPVPPPAVSAQAATPALRLFGGSGGQYSRSQLTTFDENQSWIGVSSYPVSYSFTLLNDPTTPGNLDNHIFFLPLNFFNGEALFGNHDMDYHVLNELWLRVQSGTGSPTCAVDVSWKTNAGYANPNHTELQFNNPTAVGTWTITFNSVSNGTVTAPGASPAAFTITDPNVATDFGGPMILSFGNQCNGVSANQGVPNDWAKISVSGVAGFNENDDFTKETNIDSTVWDISNSNTTNSVVLVSANDPLWVMWTNPDIGFTLETAASVASGGPAWQLPEFYNNFDDGTTNVPHSGLQGSTNWALIPADCLPTVNGTAGGTPSKNAFFRLANPGPAYP